MIDKFVLMPYRNEEKTYINIDMIISIVIDGENYKITMANSEIHKLPINEKYRKVIANIISAQTGGLL